MSDPVTFPTWRRPSRCESGHCVEVKIEDTRVLVRDSKHADQPAIVYSHNQWRRLLEAVREDLWVDDVWYPCDWRGDPEETWWRGDNADLYFTRPEIDKFCAAVRSGEFDLPEVTA